MTGPDLKGQRILVVEDEYLVADLVEAELTAAGATVLGPVATLGRALALLDRAMDVDAAVLDVNLKGEMVYPAADILRGHGIPFLFLTGYDPSIIPMRFAGLPVCEKSAASGVLVRMLAAAIAAVR